MAYPRRCPHCDIEYAVPPDASHATVEARPGGTPSPWRPDLPGRLLALRCLACGGVATCDYFADAAVPTAPPRSTAAPVPARPPAGRGPAVRVLALGPDPAGCARLAAALGGGSAVEVLATADAALRALAGRADALLADPGLAPAELARLLDGCEAAGVPYLLAAPPAAPDAAWAAAAAAALRRIARPGEGPSGGAGGRGAADRTPGRVPRALGRASARAGA